MYNGPAGVVISREDANRIIQWSLADNTTEGIELRHRLLRFRHDAWGVNSDEWKAILESCTPAKIN